MIPRSFCFNDAYQCMNHQPHYRPHPGTIPTLRDTAAAQGSGEWVKNGTADSRIHWRLTARWRYRTTEDLIRGRRRGRWQTRFSQTERTVSGLPATPERNPHGQARLGTAG